MNTRKLLTPLILLAGLWVLPGCGTYNQLVSLNEGVNTQWAQVDTVLQRRYDLIPNLVETVKGFAKQEQTVLTEVTRLRSQWGEAKTPDQKAGTATQLEGALGRLMVVMENYPQIKSNANFMALQDELSGTENRISVERRRYNEAVQAYNTAAKSFPNNLIAGKFSLPKSRTYFETPQEARSAPKVQF